MQPTASFADHSGGSALRGWAYVSGGVGIAGVLSFVVLGTMSRSTFDDLRQTCPNDHCTPDRAEDIRQGRREQTLANVGLGIGIGGLGLATVLFVAGSPKRADKSASAPEPPSARLVVLPGGARIEGRF